MAQATIDLPDHFHTPGQFVVTDWSFLDDAFKPSKIRVTDIDGLVERNGQFLVLEAKAPGIKVNRGQTILFEQMVLTGVFTVMVIDGKYSHDMAGVDIWYLGEASGTLQRRYEKCDQDGIFEFVQRWFTYARKKH